MTFFKEPINFADRFADVNIDNYKNRVIFDLLLTEERINDTPTGIWIYYLSVYEKPNGKSFAIANYGISSDGKVLGDYKYKW